MCGRVTLTIPSYERLCEELEVPAKAEDAALYRPRFNVAPTDPHWDLVIEIASKSDKFETLIEKALFYQRCGVKEVYLFSIQIRQVFRYLDQPTPVVLTETQEFRPELIPGFAIRISDLLAMI